MTRGLTIRSFVVGRKNRIRQLLPYVDLRIEFEIGVDSVLCMGNAASHDYFPPT